MSGGPPGPKGDPGTNGAPGTNGTDGVDGTNGFIKSAQAAITAAFSKASPVQLADDTLLKEYLRLELKRFIQTKTGSRPVITPVIQKI